MTLNHTPLTNILDLSNSYLWNQSLRFGEESAAKTACTGILPVNIAKLSGMIKGDSVHALQTAIPTVDMSRGVFPSSAQLQTFSSVLTNALTHVQPVLNNDNTIAIDVTDIVAQVAQVQTDITTIQSAFSAGQTGSGVDWTAFIHDTGTLYTQTSGFQTSLASLVGQQINDCTSAMTETYGWSWGF